MVINLATERDKRAMTDKRIAYHVDHDPALLWGLLAINFAVWAMVISVGVALWNR